MTKRETYVIGVSATQKECIRFAARKEQRDMAVIGREAMSEWMEKRGYQWADDLKPLKRPHNGYESLSEEARAKNVSRQTTRYHANKKNKENK